MPSLQQFDANECIASNMRSLTGAGTDIDILQKHSINSILEQRQDFLNRRNAETEEIISSLNDPIAITDFLNLDSKPNMVNLGGHNMESLATPALTTYTPLTPSSTHSSVSPRTLSSNSFDVFQFDNVAQSTPLKATFPRNISFDCTAPLSPSTTPTTLYNRSFHNSPMVSDSSNSSSANGLSLDPLVYQNNLNNLAGGSMANAGGHSGNGSSFTRSDSPESQNSNQSNKDASLLDMMNLLSITNEKQQHAMQQQVQQNLSGQMSYFKYAGANSSNTTSATITPGPTTPNLFDEQIFQSIDLELAKLQNIQALNALKLLQQAQTQAPFLNQLLQGYNNVSNQLPIKNWQLSQMQQNSTDTHLDRMAQFYRSSAAFSDANCTWSGQLPPRSHRILTYSPKVFLGGIPWDLSEQSLIQIFKPFGQIRVEWPGKEQQAAQPKGYAYIIFESDKQVKALLSACVLQVDDSQSGGIYYYKISSRRIKAKDVEVKPWIIGDSNYVKATSQKLDPTKTVFVGALHGKLTAEGLATIMDDLFDGVLYAGIDTDKYKYPIGSGRVTFNNSRSYMKAVSAAFIDIRTSKFTKKVQVNPYLEDSLCSICGVQHGPYFCRELSCFRYFCFTCWQWQHTTENVKNHKPLTRNSKSQNIMGLGPSSSTTSLSSVNSTTQQMQQHQKSMQGQQQQLLNQHQQLQQQQQQHQQQTQQSSIYPFNKQSYQQQTGLIQNLAHNVTNV